MNTLAHLTLNTGHLRMSPRSEVSEETIRVLDPAVRGGKHTVQGMQIEVHRKKNGASFGIGIRGKTMVLGALVWNEATAETTWLSMAEAYRGQHMEEPTADMPEAVPWLAVMLPCSDAVLATIGTHERGIRERLHGVALNPLIYDHNNPDRTTAGPPVLHQRPAQVLPARR